MSYVISRYQGIYHNWGNYDGQSCNFDQFTHLWSESIHINFVVTGAQIDLIVQAGLLQARCKRVYVWMTTTSHGQSWIFSLSYICGDRCLVFMHSPRLLQAMYDKHLCVWIAGERKVKFMERGKNLRIQPGFECRAFWYKIIVRLSYQLRYSALMAAEWWFCMYGRLLHHMSQWAATCNSWLKCCPISLFHLCTLCHITS